MILLQLALGFIHILAGQILCTHYTITFYTLLVLVTFGCQDVFQDYSILPFGFVLHYSVHHIQATSDIHLGI